MTAPARTLTRRAALSGLIGLSALALAAPLKAQTLFASATLRGGLDADLAGLVPDTADDQSRLLQRAIDRAAADGAILRLPAGSYLVSNITLPDGTRIVGVPGATRLVYTGRGHGLIAEGAARIELADLVIDGANQRLGDHATGLVTLRAVAETVLAGVTVTGASKHGIALEGVGGRIERCAVTGAAFAGIYAVESRGLSIRDNHVADCANGGILVHRWSKGEDGTVVSGNRIARISARAGGTGQNGNGINVFRAGNVMVTNNHVSDCAFSAIRANSADNLQVVSNQAIRSGETALYVEFAFEGAVIADNLVDGAAIGVSVANFNEGGRLAVVSGNVIRNLSVDGPYPAENAGFGIGIAVEADAAVSGNTIEGAPKWGVLAGWGPYLRDVAITGNVIREAGAGVAVSVVEGAGQALVANNLFSATPRGAVVGTRWNEEVTGDLAVEGAATWRHLRVEGNGVS